MGCCNEPVNTLTGTAPDPSQHVNYARGMVLGVDDFVQEFAYLAERDHWLARDAIGYGTLAGLRVFAENDGVEGPRLHVTAGSALVPSGKHVCVPADQCAVINRWLAKPDNAAIINRLLSPSPPMSPPLPDTAGTVSLYLTLCYADCKTRPVPIPGEPCRSEDELMAPSRIADDFRLELRETAPLQTEEDALRDFVRWLRSNLLITDSTPSPASDESAWLAALRGAMNASFSASASPPLSSPPSLDDYLFDMSPPGLALGAEQVSAFLQVAFRFWVTELRPLWMALRCHAPRWPDTDCLLLARVSFEVSWIGGSPTGVWQITGVPPEVHVDESNRPLLIHARLFQEWELSEPGTVAPYAPGGAVVAVPDGGTGMSAAPADGDLLIGSGGAFALASLAGTPEQVNVTVGPGSLTLSTPQDISAASRPAFAGLTTTGAVHVGVVSTTTDLTLDDSHHLVICDGGQSLMLPKSGAATLGRLYTVKSVNSDSKVLPDSADGIDGPATSGQVKKGNAKTFVSDGVSTWHVIATVA